MPDTIKKMLLWCPCRCLHKKLPDLLTFPPTADTECMEGRKHSYMSWTGSHRNSLSLQKPLQNLSISNISNSVIPNTTTSVSVLLKITFIHHFQQQGYHKQTSVLKFQRLFSPWVKLAFLLVSRAAILSVRNFNNSIFLSSSQRQLLQTLCVLPEPTTFRLAPAPCLYLIPDLKFFI